MGGKKYDLLHFETDEEEANYWDTHSPLDNTPEPKAEHVTAKRLKNRSITIRLDSESRSKFDKLAAQQGLGPSSFGRLILMSVIDHEIEVKIQHQRIALRKRENK